MVITNLVSSQIKSICSSSVADNSLLNSFRYLYRVGIPSAGSMLEYMETASDVNRRAVGGNASSRSSSFNNAVESWM